MPAGYCVLTGQYSVDAQVTVQETILTGCSVSSIIVRSSNGTVNQDQAIGRAVVKIGTGVTEVIFSNLKRGVSQTQP